MGFGRWVEDIAKVSDPGWNAQAFRDAADGLRLNNKVVTLRLPGGVQPDGAAADSAWAPTGWGADLQPDFEETQVSGFMPVLEEEVKPASVSPQPASFAATQFQEG